jgi:hypothetical protein
VPRSPRGLCATRAPRDDSIGALDDWPVSGLATLRPAFPRMKRSGVDTFPETPRGGENAMKAAKECRKAREGRLATCVAVAYRCGGSTGWRVPAIPVFASCFPFDCAARDAGASTKSPASVGARAGAVKKAPARFVRASKEKHHPSIAHLRRCPPIPHTNHRVARKIACCYVSKRDNYRKLR